MGPSVPSQVKWMNNVFAQFRKQHPAYAKTKINVVWIPWANRTWGQPKTIVPAAGLSNLFPQFSADGKWIAYSRGKGGHGDLTAQLFVVDSAGTKPVVPAACLSLNAFWYSREPTIDQTSAPSPEYRPIAM